MADSAPTRRAIAAEPIRVAVENGSGGATAAEVAAQLNDDTFFDFAATVVTASQIDTLAELMNYDVVILGDSGSGDPDWTQAMANALVDWAQNQGGGVVTVGWADLATGNGADDTRDAILDAIFPIDAFPDTSNVFCSGPTITINILPASHPVTEGLSTFELPTSDNIEISPEPPDATNGQVLATGSSTDSCSDATTNAVVVGEFGPARLVYLGPVYYGNVGYDNGDLRTGTPDQLLEQAVAWAAKISDADGDGVLDDDDECPGTPEGTDVDSNGCPEDDDQSVRNVSGAIGAILNRPDPLPTRSAPGAATAPTGTLGAPRTGDAGLAAAD